MQIDPTATTAMLIRKPIHDVFEAIVNPDITTKFWFSKGSARLEPGKTVRWEWEPYNVAIDVHVIAIEPDKRVLIEWPGYSGQTEVEWTFQSIPEGTFIQVKESGWKDEPHKLLRYVADSTEGFTISLAGLKAFLEHNIQLNLTFDRFPKSIQEQASAE